MLRLYSSEARERMNYDVCIVGAGPSGLSAAIKIKQLAKEKEKDISVCVIEKGAEVGAHILSGNVFEPRALDELLPNWKDLNPPTMQEVTRDRFYMLSERHARRNPVPPAMWNKGNYVVSLSQLVRWMAGQAEALGVEIYPGFAASEVLYDRHGAVCGVATNDVGIAKDGSRKPTFARGVELASKLTLFAEGARGSLSQVLYNPTAQTVMQRYNLRRDCDPQTYALGLKEVWQVDPARHQPGEVVHTAGWPLPSDVYGGSWIYHMADGLVSIGFVVALDYRNPYLSPYQEFQRFKTHPYVAKLLEGGTCLQYGARTLNEGGLQSLPRLTFPGGALVGCAAGTLNVAKIKGTHTAMKSGMLAAEAAVAALNASPSTASLDMGAYQEAFDRSWVHEELHRARNLRPAAARFGMLGMIVHQALRGAEPWTLSHRHADHESTLPAAECTPIDYPKPNGVTSFDLATSVYRSGTNHDHDQPAHLRLVHEGVPRAVNVKLYAAPETRYCPAGVYEYKEGEHGQPELVINAQNCLHCKACDIKDPTQNIRWTVPEGGGGPAYTLM